MAATIKVSHGADGKPGDAPRRDFFFLHPKDIIRDDSKNRRRRPVPDSEIKSLAENMMEIGNQQPVQARKIKVGSDKGRVELVFGYSRHRAAELIADKLRPADPVMLKVILVDANDDEASLHNIAENRFRNKTVAIDDAWNQRWLRDEKGWNDGRIAQFYKMHVSQVSKLKILLTLAGTVQDAISDREISADAGYTLADLPESDQVKTLKELRKSGAADAHYTLDATGEASATQTMFAAKDRPSVARTGKDEAPAVDPNPVKIKTAKVKAAVRAAKEGTGEAGPTRGRKEIVDFFANLDAAGEDEVVRKFGQRVWDFARGEATERQMMNAVYAMRDEKTKRDGAQ